MSGARIRWLKAVFLLGLAFAASWSFRVGWADYKFQSRTVSGAVAALRWTPDSSAYWERLSLLRSGLDPADSQRALETAVRLNPLDSTLWIDLALRAEISGDATAAEQRLLKAAELDRGYTPRWSLANFYVRQNRPQEFWRWFDESLRTVPSDATPLFRLARQFIADDDRLAEHVRAAKPDVQSAFLSFLAGQGRAALLGDAALSLAGWHRTKDVPQLLATCDELLAAGGREGALRVWNELAGARKIPFPALHPENGVSLTNPEFRVSPSSHGFDWRLPPTSGVRAALEENPAGIRLSFSGDEPESSQLLTQLVALDGNARYHLDFRFATTGIDAPSGLTWQAFDAADGAQLARSQDLAASAGAMGKLDFTTPPGSRWVNLVLVYQRAPGTTRLRGTLALREFHLSLASAK